VLLPLEVKFDFHADPGKGCAHAADRPCGHTQHTFAIGEVLNVANVVVKTGDLEILGVLKAEDTLFKGKLYKNDVTPSVATILADLTVANFSGYSNATLAWGTPFINGSDKGEMDASQLTWTHNGGGTNNTIYGFYVVNDDETILIYAERFPAPILMDAIGAEIKYTPRFTCVTE